MGRTSRSSPSFRQDEVERVAPPPKKTCFPVPSSEIKRMMEEEVPPVATSAEHVELEGTQGTSRPEERHWHHFPAGLGVPRTAPEGSRSPVPPLHAGCVRPGQGTSVSSYVSGSRKAISRMRSDYTRPWTSGSQPS